MTHDNSGALAIRVSAGQGTGLTRLSAFDAALRDAGIADFNLVRLSSVIPPEGTVEKVGGGDQLRGSIGDVLYCVYADSYASTPGEEAWAGVAWAQRDPRPSTSSTNSGIVAPGVFVEHSATSRQLLERDLRASVDDLTRARPGSFPRRDQLLSSARCVDHPVCAIVVATYRAQSWSEMSATLGATVGRAA